MEPDSSRPGLYTRFARRIGHGRGFAWMMKHVGSTLDRVLFRATAGRLWLSGPEVPTMLLTTRGRKTGKARTVPVYYVRDGENLIAACENFGLEKASSWPKNALAHPDVAVQIGGSMQEYRVRPATDGDESAFCSGLKFLTNGIHTSISTIENLTEDQRLAVARTLLPKLQD